MGVHEVSQMDPETDGPRYPDDEPLPPTPIEEYERKAAADVRVIKARTEMIQVENAGHSTRRTEETAHYRAETERERLGLAHEERLKELAVRELEQQEETERTELRNRMDGDQRVVVTVVRSIAAGIVAIIAVIALGTYNGHVLEVKKATACINKGKDWVQVTNNTGTFECR